MMASRLLSRPINIIVLGFDGPAGTRILERAFEGVEVGKCFVITRREEDAAKVPARSCVFHGHLSPGRMDWNRIRPLDEEFIERMRSCEAMVMHMMSRRETDGRVLPYLNRKRLYLQLLRYWNHFLGKEKIDLFLSYNIPHFEGDYVAYCACKAKGIPTLLLSPGDPLLDTLFVHEEIEDPAQGLRERVENLKGGKEHQTAELPKHVEDYVRSQTDERSEQNSRPWYHKMPFPRLPWSLSPLRRSFVPRYARHLHRLLEGRRMFRFYDQHAAEPDLSKKFIYVPLHMQPECNTCPLAGAYVDQELVVQMLGALVPDDILLYVKEHPYQEERHPDGMCRSLRFYQDLFAVRNVRFIPREWSSFPLVEHSLAVATCTGTAGFEGLFRGKPFLMFGHRFHQEAPGVYPIRTVEDCSNALHAILQQGAKPTLPDIRLFLRLMLGSSTHGYSDSSYRMATQLSDSENEENVGGALHSKIQHLLMGQSLRPSP